MSKINIEQLRKEIQGMTRSKKLYHVLKEELGKLGFWKNRPRGNPKKGWAVKNKQEV